MKSTGIVRKVDDLGRIVLPIELRRTMNISEKDPLEIFMEGEKIILRKHAPGCSNCGSLDVRVSLGSVSLCEDCLDKLNRFSELSEKKGA